MNGTKYRMTIAYDGTEFSGWQVQINDISIQSVIEQAICRVTKEHVRISGAGRTDAGVHALGQVAHVVLSEPRSLDIPIDVLRRSLNGVLPPTIRICHIDVVPQEFHAQLSAIGKEYHYTIVFDDVVLPFERPYVWHYPRRVDMRLLREAALRFIGTHDFKAFANTSGVGCGPKTTVRTIHRLDVNERPGGIRLEFQGTGFLYKMVRNITGMIVAVAAGKRTLEDIDTVFASGDRRLADRAAPPQGLCLIKVFYPSTHK